VSLIFNNMQKTNDDYPDSLASFQEYIKYIKQVKARQYKKGSMEPGSHILIYSDGEVEVQDDSDWIRDLTRENIEKNPGPGPVRRKNNKKRNPKYSQEQQKIMAEMMRRIALRERRMMVPKYYDVSSSSAVSASGVLIKWSGVPIGFAQSQRETNMVMTNMDLTFVLFYNFSSAALLQDITAHFRIDTFLWFSDDTVDSPQLADILTQYTTPYIAKYNPEQKRKYRILKRIKRCVIGFGDSVTSSYVPTSLSERTIDIVQRMRAPVRFALGSVTTGTGHLYSWITSDSAFTPHPSAQWCGRIEYTDDWSA